ncbi:MAG TPA: RsmG family class I SAM-dependent methyltransferase [Euzebyales bacterium]|nr:RsmG family class I SAM-dependent methyltransferase [Euzebyales bacterium]
MASSRSVPLRPQALSDDWLDTLADLIASSPVNLVSRGDRADVRRVHVDECVAVAAAMTLEAGASWMDLGTGGGLPGLVLAASFPATAWTLLDARAKKLAQVERFATALEIGNITTLHGRAENLADDAAHRARYAGVVARAVGSLEVTLALARGFVAGGDVVAIRGPRARDEAAAIVRWCDRLGMTVETVEEISGTMRPTWLIRLRGRGPAPAPFPRVRSELLQTARGGTR